MKHYKEDEEVEYIGAVYPQLHGKIGIVTRIPIKLTRGEQVTVEVTFDGNKDKPYCLMTESIRRANGYLIGNNKNDESYIQCLTCDKKSYSRGDIEHKYCAKCDWLHELRMPRNGA